MEAEDVDRLRRAWGKKPCRHPALEAEHHLGLVTGFYACTTCGHIIWPTDVDRVSREGRRRPDLPHASEPSRATGRVLSRRVRSLILIVEDEDDARTIYGRSIEFAGFRIALARDGEGALAIAAETLPDLIVLDLVLPKVDGWEVARRLKGDKRTKRIPIVALTGHAVSGYRERAMEAGCDRFLTKPCAPDDLAATLDELLKNARH